jgi:hypothetical protein
LEPFCTAGISLLINRMLAAVNFDDEFLSETDKIDDVWADRRLASKLPSSNLTASQ